MENGTFNSFERIGGKKKNRVRILCDLACTWNIVIRNNDKLEMSVPCLLKEKIKKT